MPPETKPSDSDKSPAPELPKGVRVEEPQEEPEKDVPASELSIEGAGRLVIRIDLWRMPKAMARGILLNVDDHICGWYAAQSQAKKQQQLVKPGVGVLQGIRQAGQGFKKLFTH